MKVVLDRFDETTVADVGKEALVVHSVILRSIPKNDADCANSGLAVKASCSRAEGILGCVTGGVGLRRHTQASDSG
jgi:hypothetical protein